MEKLVKEEIVADLTGLALSTLRNARHVGIGIPYHKLGRSVRYNLIDVEKYVARHRIDPERAVGCLKEN